MDTILVIVILTCALGELSYYCIKQRKFARIIIAAVLVAPCIVWQILVDPRIHYPLLVGALVTIMVGFDCKWKRKIDQ
jgi:hypothetical protein